MQISKISQIQCKSFAKPSGAINSKSLENPVNAESPSIENYGRAMVNFCGKIAIPCKQDKVFVETLADTLGLSGNKVAILRQEFSNFLKENNLKSLSEAKFSSGEEGFFEECEFIGRFTDTISKKMNLRESEADIVNLEMVKRMDEGESYTSGGESYLKEMQQLENMIMKSSNQELRNKMASWDNEI